MLDKNPNLLNFFLRRGKHHQAPSQEALDQVIVAGEVGPEGINERDRELTMKARAKLGQVMDPENGTWIKNGERPRKENTMSRSQKDPSRRGGSGTFFGLSGWLATAAKIGLGGWVIFVIWQAALDYYIGGCLFLLTLLIAIVILLQLNRAKQDNKDEDL